MWRNIELNQLSHFLAVAKTGKLTSAAEEVGISQPALSRSIQKLEHIVGEPLFERQARGVRLTEVGSFLQLRATQIKTLVDDTFVELQEASNRGQVRLAVIPTIAPYLLPRVLKGFIEKHPEIRIQVQEDTTQNIIQLSKNGDIDLAIVALPIHDKHLEVEALFKDELLLAAPNGHTLSKKKNLCLADIQEFPFISLDQQHCLSSNIAEYCSQKSVSPVSIERTNQLATVQELVALQHGISIVPSMAVRHGLSKRLCYRSFAGEKLTRTIALLQNPNRHQRRFVSLFKDYMHKLDLSD